MGVVSAGEIEIPYTCTGKRVIFDDGPCFLPVLKAHIDRMAKIIKNGMWLCSPKDESCARDDEGGKYYENGWIKEASLVNVKREDQEQAHESADRLG